MFSRNHLIIVFGKVCKLIKVTIDVSKSIIYTKYYDSATVSKKKIWCLCLLVAYIHSTSQVHVNVDN